MIKGSFLWALVLVALKPFWTLACTNYLLTKGATVEHVNRITYSADSHTLYGALYHYPAKDHLPGTLRPVVDWDSGVYLGDIEEAEHTYNVVGNSNEWGLVIGETTFGGLAQLAHQPGAVIDYGSLIYIALQRSRNVREAIDVMTSLVEQYGYASEGESFSLSDPNEVWIMEMIGKGPGHKGAVWVARRITDGYLSAHANQARITTFPRDKPNDCKYSKDVVDFARSLGLYPKDKADEDFSFSDTYNPLTFEGIRACEGRVWDFFHRVSNGMDDYLDYIQGRNFSHRMPLFIKPSRPVSLEDTMKYMRSHFEGTPLDFHGDVGAEAYELPYRWRPLTWQVEGDSSTYYNERSVSTQQTGFSFIGESRPSLPDPLKAIVFFGVDDTSFTVYTPFYGGMKYTPASYAVGDIMAFDFHSAFWVFNMVSNLAYQRYSQVAPEIQSHIRELEKSHRELAYTLDAKASGMIEAGQTEEALAMVTKAVVENADLLVVSWLKYWKYLFVKYMDGNIKTRSQDPINHPTPSVSQPGYSSQWRKRIVEETGDRYKEPVMEGKVVGVGSNQAHLGNRFLEGVEDTMDGLNVRRSAKLKGV